MCSYLFIFLYLKCFALLYFFSYELCVPSALVLLILSAGRGGIHSFFFWLFFLWVFSLFFLTRMNEYKGEPTSLAIRTNEKAFHQYRIRWKGKKKEGGSALKLGQKRRGSKINRQFVKRTAKEPMPTLNYDEEATERNCKKHTVRTLPLSNLK